MRVEYDEKNMAATLLKMLCAVQDIRIVQIQSHRTPHTDSSWKAFNTEHETLFRKLCPNEYATFQEEQRKERESWTKNSANENPNDGTV